MNNTILTKLTKQIKWINHHKNWVEIKLATGEHYIFGLPENWVYTRDDLEYPLSIEQRAMIMNYNEMIHGAPYDPRV